VPGPLPAPHSPPGTLDAVPVVTVDAPGTSLRPAADARPETGGGMATASGLVPVGRAPSCWPELVLDGIFRCLDMDTLVICRRVCRRWYQVADSSGLQALCLMRSCPAFHRRQWVAVAAGSLGRQQLAFWSGHSEPGGSRPAALAAAVAPQVPSQVNCAHATELFHAVTRTLLRAERFSLVCAEATQDLSLVQDLVACSPDAGFLAMKVSAPAGQSMTLSVWQRREAGGLRRVGQAGHGHAISCLFFGADSRRLQIVEARGQMATWEPDASGVWQRVGGTVLCDEPVSRASFSADRQYLALVSGELVFLFTVTASGSWQRQYSWCWRRSGWRCVLWREGLVQTPLHNLSFDNAGRRLLLTSWGFGGSQAEVLVCSREVAGWKEQGVNADSLSNPLHNGVAMAPDGDLLAMVSLQRMGSEVPFCMRLWRFDDRQGWCAGIAHPCRADRTDRQFPLAFSPDSRWLGFACSQGLGDASLCVVPVTGSARGQCPLVLAVVPQAQERGDEPGAVHYSAHCCLIESLEFSVTGRFLVVLSTTGMGIWRYSGSQGWDRLWWRDCMGDVVRCELPRVAFSPDTYHCAFSQGAQGEVSIWGPGSGGSYIRKGRWVAGREVYRLAFTPDATQLLVLARGERPEAFFVSRLTCLSLMPVGAGPSGEEACGSRLDGSCAESTAVPE